MLGNLRSSRSRYEPRRAPVSPGGTVQNQDASSYELRVARALDKLKLRYIFQWNPTPHYRGIGYSIVDFLVLTVPLSTPLESNGDYWHRPVINQDQVLLEAQLHAVGNLNPLVVLWGADLVDDDTTLASLRRELGM